MAKSAKKRIDLLHIVFEIGLLTKGIVGLIEMVGGVLLLFLNHERIDRIILFVMDLNWPQHRQDFVANQLEALERQLSISPHHFETIYLMAHGALKIALACLLARKKRWAYPVTIVAFSLLAAYQVYRFTVSGETFLLPMTAFDLLLIALTIREYHMLRNNKATVSHCASSVL